MKTFVLTIKTFSDTPDFVIADAINETLRSPGVYEHILDGDDEGWFYEIEESE